MSAMIKKDGQGGWMLPVPLRQLFWDFGIPGDDEPGARLQWNREWPGWVGRFLVAYMARNNLSVAALSAKATRGSVQSLRQEDSVFDEACREIMEWHIDRAEEKIYDLVVNGYENPIYQKGEFCGYTRTYPQTLMQLFMKGRRSEVFRAHVLSQSREEPKGLPLELASIMETCYGKKAIANDIQADCSDATEDIAEKIAG